MTFSGKKQLMIILKVSLTHSFFLSLSLSLSLALSLTWENIFKIRMTCMVEWFRSIL